MLLEKRTELGSYKAGSTRRTGQTVSRQAIEMMKYPRIKDESESCCRMSNWGAHSGLWGGVRDCGDRWHRKCWAFTTVSHGHWWWRSVQKVVSDTCVE